MTPNNGGPAFPILGMKDGCTFDNVSGMTLRDYFAAKALPIAAKVFESGHPNGWEGIAIAAYIIADAMLAAREGDKA